MKTEFLDSTLRDGSQSEGISFSIQDKINIVKALDEFGADYIEAGNPASNPKDAAFFKQIEGVVLKNAKLCAFGATHKFGITPEEDEALKTLAEISVPAVSVFGKAWKLHVTEILGIRPEDNLNMVRDTVRYLKEHGKEVLFDAEHFFDGWKENEAYAMAVLEAAVAGGADCVCLCDTNGGSIPSEVYEICRAVCDRIKIKIAIHCHNDCGCAVANSIAAVQAGAAQVQGTFTGFGERCGNTDLSTLIPTLILKCGSEMQVRLDSLSQTASKIAGIANVVIRNDNPYIGKSAFAHKAGMHIDGVMKTPVSFEHVAPEAVGNHRRFLMSEVSGRSTILPKLREYAPGLTKDSPETIAIVNKLKENEMFGYHYEAADASFEILIKKQLGLWRSFFNVMFYKTTDDFPAPNGELQSSAIVQIEADGKTEVAGDVGNGPVNALDRALRRALEAFYPQIKDIFLIDFKVRVIDQSSTTSAKVRVLIESSDGCETWTTIGVSNDVIEASFIALVDSLEYKLSKI